MSRLLLAPFKAVSAEQCAPVHFYFSLHSFGLLPEPFSSSGFALRCGAISDYLFSVIKCGCPTPYHVLLVSQLFNHFAYALTTVDREQPMSLAVLEMFVPRLREFTM